MGNEDCKLINILNLKRDFKERREEIIKGALIGALLQLSDELVGVILIMVLKKLNLILIDGFFAFTDKLIPSEGFYFQRAGFFGMVSLPNEFLEWNWPSRGHC